MLGIWSAQVDHADLRIREQLLHGCVRTVQSVSFHKRLGAVRCPRRRTFDPNVQAVDSAVVL